MDYTPDSSSTGMQPTVAAGLAVLLGWIGGLVFFLIEKESKFVKFYGIQNVFLYIPFVLAVVPFVNFIIALYGLALGSFPVCHVGNDLDQRLLWQDL